MFRLGLNSVESLIPQAEHAAQSAMPALGEAANPFMQKVMKGKTMAAPLPAPEMPQYIKDMRPIPATHAAPVPGVSPGTVTPPPPMASVSPSGPAPAPLPSGPMAGAGYKFDPELAKQRLEEAYNAGIMGGKWGDRAAKAPTAMAQPGAAPRPVDPNATGRVPVVMK